MRSDIPPRAAWLWALRENVILHAGPSVQMNWISTGGVTGTSRRAGLRGADQMAAYGSSVMVAPDKILTLAGGTVYTGVPGSRQSHLISVSGSGFNNMKAKVTRVGDLTYGRGYCNAVVLPTGAVVVIGGQSILKPFSDSNAILAAELWEPN